MNRQDAMTSEKVLLSTWPRRAAARWGSLFSSRSIVVFALMAMGLLVVGCERLFPQRIEQPRRMVSPYPAAKLWAVAPFHNESGASVADPVRMADKLTQRLQQVEDIQVLPVNRVLAAMQQEGLQSPPTELDQAMRLMQRLDADGLIVGTLTAWNPYDPPKLGASIALFSRRNPRTDNGLDTRALSGAATDDLPSGATVYQQPVAEAGGYFDAANGRVVKQLRDYATGRTPSDSPSGWRRYLLSMDLYLEFVSHRLASDLLEEEWWRLTRAAAPSLESDGDNPNREP